MRPLAIAFSAALLAGSLLAGSLLGGCAKKQDKPAPADSALTLTEIEIKRGQDACTAYREQVCAAAARKPDRKDLAEACQLAPALADAVRTGLDVARHPESARLDVLQAQDAVRKAMDRCVQGVAQTAAE